MQKKTKWKIAALGLGLAVLTGCTQSFCTVQDKSNMMVQFEYAETNGKNNLQTIIDQVNDTGNYYAPSEAFFDYVEERVAEIVIESYSNNKFVYGDVETTYGKMTVEQLTEDNSVINQSFVKTNEYALTKYAKENSTSLDDMWSNYNMFRKEAVNHGLTIDDIGSDYYHSSMQATFNNYAASITACITPVDGVFDGLHLEGKSWGDAFNYGLLEGLLVWPISAMIYYFAVGFSSLGVGGIILAIFFATLIIRAFLMLITLKQTMSQTKIQELQPELESLQRKYPNADKNEYEKQQLAQAQLALYKKYKINPFGMIITLILQFIIFIPVWGAMSGSAILRNGDLWGLSLSASTGNSILNWTGWPSGVALILFLIMALCQAISMFVPQIIQKQRQKKLNNGKKMPTNPQAKTMRITQIIMFGMILFTGFFLPVAMAIYWTISAIITLGQSLFIQLVVKRHAEKQKFAKYKTK